MTVTCRVVYRFVRMHAVTAVRPGRRRWPAAVAMILLPTVAFLAVAAMAHSSAIAIVPAIGIVPTNESTAAALHAPIPAYTFKIVASSPVQGARTRAALHDARHTLAADLAVEKGLQVKTILAARAISAKFPQIHSIGGVRPDGLRWHPDGLALDVMIPDYQSPGGKVLGDRIVAYVRAHADELALDHVIWRQVLYLPNGTVRSMGNRGSDNANHFNHLHIATKGGGFPTGEESYFTSVDGVPAISIP